MGADLIAYLDRRDAEMKDYLEHGFEAQQAQLNAFNGSMDRRLEALVAHLEAVEARNIERFDRLGARLDRLEARMDRLEARMDRLEARMDQLERRVDRMDVRIEERFLSLEQKVDSMALRIEQFETRTLDSLNEMRQSITQLKSRVTALSKRVGRLEDGLLQLNFRVDGFTDDMRQRFRVVNERLAELAA